MEALSSDTKSDTAAKIGVLLHVFNCLKYNKNGHLRLYHKWPFNGGGGFRRIRHRQYSVSRFETSTYADFTSQSERRFRGLIRYSAHPLSDISGRRLEVK